MKYLPLGLVLSLSLFVGVNAANAAPQTVTRTVVVKETNVVTVNPVRRAVKRAAAAVVLSSLPRNSVSVFHSGRTYYVANGTYYIKEPRGYVVVTPAPGLAVRSLPRGVVTVRNNGRVTYRYNNISYRRVNGVYVVV